jgi:hypothetical protein
MAVRSPALPARYRDARPVGRGGMADIYRATDAELGRPVAVKVLADRCAEDPDIRARFLLEARAAARLSGDPHTVTIYDVGETQGRPYLVMEYLPGGSLAARLGAGRIDQALALEWQPPSRRQAAARLRRPTVTHSRSWRTSSSPARGPGRRRPPTFRRRLNRSSRARSPRSRKTGSRHASNSSPRCGPRSRRAASTAPTGVMVRRRSRPTPLAIATALAFGLVAFVLTAALTTGTAAKPPPTVVQTVTVPTTRQGRAAVRHATPSTPAAVSDQRPGKHHGKHHRRGLRQEKGENDGEG